VSQGMAQAVCSARHGAYFVANTHDLWHDWSRIAPGVVLGTGLFAIYGIGLGSLLKNQIVAIVVGLIFTLVVETIVVAIWPTIGEYLPGQAATALEDAARTTFGGGSVELLPWWGGAAMLLVYGVALALVGTFTTLRSDIT
jgi:ABC-2 type transport system permease protein